MKQLSTLKPEQLISFAVVASLICGVAGFAIGMQYQQMKTPTMRQFGSGQGGGRQIGSVQGQNGSRGAFRPVNGEVIDSDENTITVKLPDGGSKIVVLSDKTDISTSTKVDKTELKIGENVAVFGTDNSDGSVDAAMIQLNPAQNQIRMMGSPNPSASSLSR